MLMWLCTILLLIVGFLLMFIVLLQRGRGGGLAGALLGALVAMAVSLLHYGGAALVNLPGADMVLSVGMAVVVGFLLSLVGVLYPAILASRMQPVEAMRVEQ